MGKLKQPRTADGRFASFASVKKSAKTSVKKSATVKKSEQVKAPKVEGLKNYDGYDLSSKGETVRFGCGAVTVNKSDLLALAALKESEVGKAGLRALSNLKNAAGSYRSMTEIINISADTLRRLAAVNRKGRC